MSRTGRPRIQIDKSMFEKLCGLMCSEEDIAYFFNCSIDTICNWCKQEYGETFSDIYKKKCVAGKISLRRNQWKLSEKNASMAIFLGKNYLGQKDNVELVDNREINNQIQNIANLINQPKKVRTEEDIENN